jgi:hypothetical protein
MLSLFRSEETRSDYRQSIVVKSDRLLERGSPATDE